VIGGHLPFTLSSSHLVTVSIRILEYSITYSIEYSSTALVVGRVGSDLCVACCAERNDGSGDVCGYLCGSDA